MLFGVVFQVGWWMTTVRWGSPNSYFYYHYYNNNHFTPRWTLSGTTGWASSRRNIHPLTPIVVINHPLCASSIVYDSWRRYCSIYMPDSLFPRSLSKFSLVHVLAWCPPLHTPYISLPNHCLLFAAHAHTIATCIAVVSKLCHLILVSHSTNWIPQLEGTSFLRSGGIGQCSVVGLTYRRWLKIEARQAGRR